MRSTGSRLSSEWRGRIAWGWLPIAALVSAALSYALHHALPLDEHGALLAAAVVGVAAFLSVVAGVLARPAERQLPVIVTLQPGATGVRAMSGEDVGFGAAIHSSTLQHGFFAALGFGFLRAYYATFVASPYAAAFVSVAGDAQVGLVVGATDARAHARWVLRHRGLRLALRGIATMLLRPRPALRFARTRIARYRGAWKRARGRAAPDTVGEGRQAVLTHIAVVPGGQGAGIGTALVTAFTDAARDAGAARIHLVTLEGEDGATGFYERLGWRPSGRRPTYDGASVAAFTLDLERTPD